MVRYRFARWALVLGTGALAACASQSEEPRAAEDLQESYGPLESAKIPTGTPAQYPIVLAHGFDASPTNRWGFYKVAEALRADGHTVYEAVVEPYNTPQVRARSLAQTVDKALETSSKVHILAHSMGGLDARVLISEYGYGDRVATLTTISTPHRGSAMGDVALKFLPGFGSGFLNALASALGRTFTEHDLANDSNLRGALAAISEKSAAEFNRAHPDDSRVHYQSWAGVSAQFGIGDDRDHSVCGGTLPSGRADLMDASLRAGAIFVGHGLQVFPSFRPNDGMVTVESAKWGDFRGCIRADHLDEVGQPKHDQPNQRTKFDHRSFYREIAFGLAEWEKENRLYLR